MTPNEMTDRRFSNRSAQLVVAAAYFLLSGVAFSVILVPNRGSRSVGAVFGVMCLAMVVRSLNSSDVCFTASAAITRSLLRTRRHSYADLLRVRVAQGRTGLNSGIREFLVFEYRDGRVFAFRELNCRPAVNSLVRQAADEAHRRLGVGS